MDAYVPAGHDRAIVLRAPRTTFAWVFESTPQTATHSWSRGSASAGMRISDVSDSGPADSVMVWSRADIGCVRTTLISIYVLA